jgi:hypothetical protein
MVVPRETRTVCPLSLWPTVTTLAPAAALRVAQPASATSTTSMQAVFRTAPTPCPCALQVGRARGPRRSARRPAASRAPADGWLELAISPSADRVTSVDLARSTEGGVQDALADGEDGQPRISDREPTRTPIIPPAIPAGGRPAAR